MAPLSVADRRNLTRRVLSGAVLTPLALLLAFKGGVVLGLALLTTSAIALREWFQIVTGKSQIWAVSGLGLVLALYWTEDLKIALAGMGVTALLIGAIIHARGHGAWLSAFGLPYTGLMMLSLAWLRDRAGAGWPMVFFALLVVWMSDIGAFFVGRMVGGPRLAPAISPNKTWAGFAGALAFSTLIAIIWSTWVSHAARPDQAIAIAIALSLVEQGGDLFESAVKRRFRVKDSGELIPGHGGMLDRIDGLLWAAPFFAFLHKFGLTSDLLP